MFRKDKKRSNGKEVQNVRREGESRIVKKRKTRKIKCTGIGEAAMKHIFINKRKTEKIENEG
jgi:hypothetical protein